MTKLEWSLRIGGGIKWLCCGYVGEKSLCFRNTLMFWGDYEHQIGNLLKWFRAKKGPILQPFFILSLLQNEKLKYIYVFRSPIVA